jgi:hypothetical protein
VVSGCIRRSHACRPGGLLTNRSARLSLAARITAPTPVPPHNIRAVCRRCGKSCDPSTSCS